jgi:hypothetical protein
LEKGKDSSLDEQEGSIHEVAKVLNLSTTNKSVSELHINVINSVKSREKRVAQKNSTIQSIETLEIHTINKSLLVISFQIHFFNV